MAKKTQSQLEKKAEHRAAVKKKKAEEQECKRERNQCYGDKFQNLPKAGAVELQIVKNMEIIMASAEENGIPLHVGLARRFAEDATRTGGARPCPACGADVLPYSKCPVNGRYHQDLVNFYELKKD